MCPDKHTYKIPHEYHPIACQAQGVKVRDFLLESSMKTFYVYGHFVPNSKEPFYIGKGTGRRYKKRDNRNKWWKNIVAKYGFEARILHDGLTELEALELEKQLIKEYGRLDNKAGPLVNLTDGGEAPQNVNVSESTREKLRTSSKRYWDNKSEKEKSDIAKQRWNQLSEESKQKHRNKIGKSSQGRKHSEESRQRNREVQKQVWEGKPEKEKSQYRELCKSNGKRFWETITPEQLEAHRTRSRETAMRRWEKQKQSKR
jgi:hypothetical protein